MLKYIVLFTCSSGSWARMINSPGDRTTVVQRTLESLGGSLECLYWELGGHDGYSIIELPDSVSAEAVERAMSKAGNLTSIETHELLTQQQLIDPCISPRTPGRFTRYPVRQTEVRGTAVCPPSLVRN